MKEKCKNRIGALTIVVLFAVIFVLILRVNLLRNNYLSIIEDKQIIQVFDGVKYQVFPVSNKSYRMVIGDIIGIDKKSFEFVDNYSIDTDLSYILVPGIKKEYPEINTNIFFEVITNDNNVFIPDNFCIKNWPSNINEDIYTSGLISAGNFCNSEPETRIIDTLIKQYNPENIVIYYSNQTQKELIGNFLVYLDDLGFKYSLEEIK